MQAALANYIIESEYKEFNECIDILICELERNTLGCFNESILSSFSDKVKGGIAFIKEFSAKIGMNLLDLLKLFKQKIIFAFFTKISWSFKKMIAIVKKGYKLWHQLHDVIAAYIAESKIGKFTDREIKKLDIFLQNHPVLKRAGALVVVGFLIYQWTNMISFTGDIDFDFDQSALFAAISGNYSLADLFTGPDGIKMLLFIATGVLTGASFPWPGNTWVLFSMSLIYTVSKHKYPQLSSNMLQLARKYK